MLTAWLSSLALLGWLIHTIKHSYRLAIAGCLDVRVAAIAARGEKIRSLDRGMKKEKEKRKREEEEAIKQMIQQLQQQQQQQ